jgi:DNA processing protein
MTEAWLRLANLQLPARLSNSLLECFPTVEALFGASAAQLEQVPGMTLTQLTRILDTTFAPTAAQIDYLRRNEIELLTQSSPNYPSNLLQISDAPAVLFTRGEVLERDRFAVALVGSRKATPYGRSITARLARELSAAGLTVVSGGALGIDAAGHQATVDAGGRTIAVLGCGLDIDYPKDNQGLFARIVREERGAVMTEFPLGAAPEPWRFPMRNRIISGLAMGVVVVEAGDQSGALLTATIAAEQGRDVMAVPGNVDRESSRGTNGLIRDGAVLVENAQDVTRALGILTLQPPEPARPQSARISPHLPDPQRKVLEYLSLAPKHIDALAADLKLASVEISIQMTLLELAGLVRRLPGNCYVRVL